MYPGDQFDRRIHNRPGTIITAALQSALFELEPTETDKNVTEMLAAVLAVHRTDGSIAAVGAAFLLPSVVRPADGCRAPLESHE